jgi:hypothetical protein
MDLATNDDRSPSRLGSFPPGFVWFGDLVTRWKALAG